MSEPSPKRAKLDALLAKRQQKTPTKSPTSADTTTPSPATSPPSVSKQINTSNLKAIVEFPLLSR